MDAKRVKFWAYEALSGFDTLDPEDATNGTLLNLCDILLHVADDPSSVALVSRIERLVNGEPVLGHPGGVYCGEVKIAPNVPL